VGGRNGQEGDSGGEDLQAVLGLSPAGAVACPHTVAAINNTKTKTEILFFMYFLLKINFPFAG
jgi:hypothetical protein